MKKYLILGVTCIMVLGLVASCGGDGGGTCTPNCAGRECGWDPACGTMNCGTCPGDRPNCNASTGACLADSCTPDCTGRECGYDPICGTLDCGTCPSDRPDCDSTSGTCSTAPCIPNCTGLQCGPDPDCGQSCGTCPSGQTCTTAGACSTTGPNCPEDHDCTGLECGPDPVCLTSCGDCSSSETCSYGRCVAVPCGSSTCSSGCCSGTICMLGNTDSACGTGGEVCSTCPSGQTCQAGNCVVEGDPLRDLQVTVIFPARLSSLGGQFFPTYLSHLIGLAAFASGGWHFAEITVQNSSTSNSYQIRSSAQLTGYSTPAEQVQTINPSRTLTINLNPTLNYPSLYALSAPVPGSMSATVEVESGPTIYSESEPTTILPKNTVIWDASVEGFDGNQLSTVMVTPHDSGHAVENLIANAAPRSIWGSLGGYQSGFQMHAESFSVDVNYFQDFVIFLESSESLFGSLAYVSGGSDNDIDVIIFDQDNYILWTGGGASSACFYGPDSLTGATYSCTPTVFGWYYLVFYNTPDNWVSRSVQTDRYLSKEEVSRRHMEALFEELFSRGMNYTSVSSDFFIGTQNVRYPADTLAGSSGNCIDGTLVFASALEAMSMDPVLIYVPGHAFIGVLSWSDTNTLLSLETTMVSTGDFWNAYVTGWNNLSDYLAAGDAILIDVMLMRSYGILPVPL